MKLKRTWIVITLVVIAVVFFMDAWWAQKTENELRQELGGPNVVGALASRIQVGMARKEVERRLAHYRQYSVFETSSELTYTYRIWFGFIPPLRIWRYKSIGSVQVVYDREGRVLSSKYWMS